MKCHDFTNKISERRHRYLSVCSISKCGTVHTNLHQQLTEHMEKTFASPSKNVDKKKEKKTQECSGDLSV